MTRELARELVSLLTTSPRCGHEAPGAVILRPSPGGGTRLRRGQGARRARLSLLPVLVVRPSRHDVRRSLRGKLTEQFVGYDQHDSQELAIYLLGAVCSTTRMKQAYVEKPDQGPDERDAETAWTAHLVREDSRRRIL